MSRMSELDYEASLANQYVPAPKPEPRWTADEFHQLCKAAAHGAWLASNLPICHAEMYSLMEAGFRAAMPDYVPSSEGV